MGWSLPSWDSGPWHFLRTRETRPLLAGTRSEPRSGWEGHHASGHQQTGFFPCPVASVPRLSHHASVFGHAACRDILVWLLPSHWSNMCLREARLELSLACLSERMVPRANDRGAEVTPW